MSSLEVKVLSCDEGDMGGPDEGAPNEQGARFLAKMAREFADRVTEWKSKQAPARAERFDDDMN